MNHDERIFRSIAASLNYQAAFGALGLGAIMLAAIAWGDRAALLVALFATLTVVVSHVIVARALDRIHRGLVSTPTAYRVAQALWYVAIVLAVISASML